MLVDIILNYCFENTEKNFKNDTSSYQILIEIFNYGQEEEVTFRNFSPLIMAKSIRSVIDTISLSIARNEVKNIDEVKKFLDMQLYKDRRVIIKKEFLNIIAMIFFVPGQYLVRVLLSVF